MKNFADLKIENESDVEQKIIYPLLNEILGYTDNEIRPKSYLSPNEIDKGAGKKVGYYPDYSIYIGGIPILVVEAKSPNINVEEGFREARLYATEVNKLFPENINPVQNLLACNGTKVLIGSWDTDENNLVIPIDKICPGLSDYESLLKLSKSNLIDSALKTRQSLLPTRWFKPLKFLGGLEVQNTELPMNTFAADLVPVLRRYFDPDLKDKEILEFAYCCSEEITKYDATLEALLKERVSKKKGIPEIKTSKKRAGIFNEAMARITEDIKDLSDPLILIIGSVGSGKSIFLERFYAFLQDDELKKKLRWAFVDFNKAPDDLDKLEEWVCEKFIEDFKERNGDDEFFDFENLKRYFAPDIRKRERGPYKVLKEQQPEEYIKRSSEDLRSWMDDPVKLSSGIVRYYTKDQRYPVVVVFDNGDKRTKEQQLKIFQVSQWFRDQNKCFVILSLRDETFDAYQNQPPLDAFLKPFAFRIMPARFIDVVKKRLKLAIDHLVRNSEKTLSYVLPGGAIISYPSTNLGRYLLSIYLSVFNPKRKIRIILEALAFRDTRRALEMFSDILLSGYMDENMFLSLTEGEANEVPEWLIIRILMRTNYKYFSDSHGYIQNVFALDEDSKDANNFLVVETLELLSKHRKKVGELKIEGYLSIEFVLESLSKVGFKTGDIWWALDLLLKKRLIVADHQGLVGLKEGDFIRISAAGFYHIRFLATRGEYFAGVCMDTFINDRDFARAISRFPKDTFKHSQERLKVFKAYLNNELERNILAIPEFDNNELGSRKIVNSIDVAIGRMEGKNIQLSFDIDEA